MTRVNVLLLCVLVACALSLVTSRHQARRLFVELEREQARARQFDVEFGQLSLEQSTWAMPARVEKIGARWAPYRTVASWYLYRVLEVDWKPRAGRST